MVGPFSFWSGTYHIDSKLAIVPSHVTCPQDSGFEPRFLFPFASSLSLYPNISHNCSPTCISASVDSGDASLSNPQYQCLPIHITHAKTMET